MLPGSVVEVGELGVPIGMLAALQGLGVRLQAEGLFAQQSGREPSPTQVNDVGTRCGRPACAPRVRCRQTFSRVLSLTGSGRLSTLLSVPMETPTRLATSCVIAGRIRFLPLLWSPTAQAPPRWPHTPNSGHGSSCTKNEAFKVFGRCRFLLSRARSQLTSVA
jgi:hypothetical protein